MKQLHNILTPVGAALPLLAAGFPARFCTGTGRSGSEDAG